MSSFEPNESQSLIRVVPLISSKRAGFTIPIPTFPPDAIRIRSRLVVARTKSLPSVVPIKLLFAAVPIGEVDAVVPLLPVKPHAVEVVDDPPDVAFHSLPSLKTCID